MDHRLRASPRHGGARRFQHLMSRKPPRGVPSGAAGIIAIEKMNYLQKYPNIRFSIGNAYQQSKCSTGVSPCCFVLPTDTITTQLDIISAISAGVVRGERHCPLLHLS